MKLTLNIIPILAISLTISCQREPVTEVPVTSGLSYGDTVFYLKADDYSISPTVSRTGTYTAFPSDLNINNATGRINVTLKGKDGKNSQTGLKYRVIYESPEGKKDSTYIVLAGINYQDKIYYMPQNETMVQPIYNGNPSLALPSGNYTSNNSKLAINKNNGQIDLKKTIENGFFNDDPQNDDWKLVNIRYTTNDGSTTDRNSIDVVIYFYTSTSHIPSNVSAAMRAHQQLLIGISPEEIPQTNAPVDDDIKNIVSAFKPRPPCIIILGR